MHMGPKPPNTYARTICAPTDGDACEKSANLWLSYGFYGCVVFLACVVVVMCDCSWLRQSGVFALVCFRARGGRVFLEACLVLLLCVPGAVVVVY